MALVITSVSTERWHHRPAEPIHAPGGTAVINKVEAATRRFDDDVLVRLPSYRQNFAALQPVFRVADLEKKFSARVRA